MIGFLFPSGALTDDAATRRTELAHAQEHRPSNGQEDSKSMRTPAFLRGAYSVDIAIPDEIFRRHSASQRMPVQLAFN
jgi:hypothetical protein